MPTKLVVYNSVLGELGTFPLADTTTPNTRLSELDGSFTPAVDYILAQRDWGFARRRAALASVADTSFPPYSMRFSRPTDYLRKCWFKAAAVDDYQLDHAETAAAIFGFSASGLLEYMSNDSSNYDPTNWPPHFTRVLVLYIAGLVAPKLARAGTPDVKAIEQKFMVALDQADEFEAIFLTNTQIPVERQPVLRRAIEFLGQQLAGSVPVLANNDRLRWHMNQAWTSSLRYVMEQGAWNFATRRVGMQVSSAEAPGYAEDPDAGQASGLLLAITQGSGLTLPDVVGFDYGYILPVDFLHKIWVKADIKHDIECSYQFMGAAIYTNSQPTVMEYIAYNDWTTDPRNWPTTFMEAVAAYLAMTVAPEFIVEPQSGGAKKITAANIREKLEKMYALKLSDAKMRDAMQQMPQMMPLGRYARARMGSIGTANFRNRFN